jgi:ParB-like chromosome segregation protein Spo0J
MATEEYKVDDIRPSRLNPRRNFNPEKLAELAASISEHGVKEPILIRKTALWAQVCEWAAACGKGAKLTSKAFNEAGFQADDWESAAKTLVADGRVSEGGRYVIAEESKPWELLDDRLGAPFLEIVAGERRWRASKLAGRETIRAVLEESMTDAQALEIALLENNQRDDLLPCEEAEGFAMQMKIAGKTAADLAQRIGKSESYVRKRVMLCRLPGNFRQAIDEGRITLKTAFIVARVPDPLIAECASAVLKGWSNQPMTEEQARNLVMTKYMTDLSAAPFKTEDATLVPEAGTCGSCRFRTGNDPALFDDIMKKSICTNTECFARKVEADMERKVAAAREQGLKILDPKEAKKELQYGRISFGSKYIDLKESHCHADPKVRTYGRIIGKDVKPIVAVDPSNRVHYLLPREEADELVKKVLKLKDKTPASGSSSSYKDYYKKEQEAARRRKEAAVKARELVAAAIGQFMPKLTPDSHKVFRAMLVHTISRTGHDAIKDALSRKPLNGINKSDYNAPRQTAAWAVSAAIDEVFAFTIDVVLAAGLGSYTWHHGGKEIQPEATLIFDALGIDIAAIEKEVTKAANDKKKAVEAKKAEREAKKALKTKARAGKGKGGARTASRPAAEATTKARAADTRDRRHRP